MTKLRLLSALAIMLFLTNCSGMKSEASYPKSDQQINDERYGKLTGEDGIVFGGGKKHVATGITVNSYLWRASLNAVSFMPLEIVDPFSGVITTSWYSDPKHPQERSKITVIIASPYLRADTVKVQIFREEMKGNSWYAMPVSPDLARTIEDKILTEARELRLAHKK